MQQTSLRQWITMIQGCEDNHIYPILDMFRHGIPEMGEISSLKTVYELYNHQFKSPAVIDRDLIQKYLEYFVSKKFIVDLFSIETYPNL